MQYASFSTSELSSWALLNNVELRGVRVESDIVDEDGSSKGGGLVATAKHSEGESFLIVPHDIVVSKEQINACVRTDVKLRELLATFAGSDFINTTRGMFIVFLLYQLTIASPGQEVGGVQNQFTDYAKFLPKDVPLPTFYSDEEKEILVGTSLKDALEHKIRGLESELEMLRQRTKGLGWARRVWWGLDPDEDEDENEQTRPAALRLDDWKLVDAIYRSRALELPEGKGIVMVPVLDMANHASDDQYNARFEPDGDGNVKLVVRDGKTVNPGDEITIMYGCGGVCEMIFSYGFLEPKASSAREMFLGLSIPLDDPLRMVKMKFSDAAPGVRLYADPAGKIRWDSDFVWWACINEEDGLDFQVLRRIDGETELKAAWKGREFEANQLKRLLMEDELRDVFVLRSLVLLQQRVEQQGVEISDSEAAFDAAKHAAGIRDGTWKLIDKLRNLELELLTAAFDMLETEKAALLNSDTVRRYLEGGGTADGVGQEEQDDFS